MIELYCLFYFITMYNRNLDFLFRFDYNEVYNRKPEIIISLNECTNISSGAQFNAHEPK